MWDLKNPIIKEIFIAHVFFISQPDEDFVETVVINYLEEGGFRICWHQRDFMPGTNIAENIADATENSRRMIFVISRYEHLTKSRHSFKFLLI